MARMKPFQYESPKELEGVFDLLSRWGEKGKVLAGGTDLVVQMRRGIAQPECIVSLRRIPELKGICESGDSLSIGSMTSLWDVAHSHPIQERWPLLVKAVSEVGSPAIRHVATIGGNLCNASPAADSAPPLLAIEASLRLGGPWGERVVPISDFFQGPSRTVVKANEVLSSIHLPPLPANSQTAYLRLGRKAKADLALVGAAIVLVLDAEGRIEVIRIGLGGVAPTAFRAKRAETLALGKALEPSLVREVAGKAAEESQPISDIRGSADYKRDLVRALVSRGLIELGCVGEDS
jgi:aerobic carbon-monoxide dehydrogenase medium subunit